MYWTKLIASLHVLLSLAGAKNQINGTAQKKTQINVYTRNHISEVNNRINESNAKIDTVLAKWLKELSERKRGVMALYMSWMQTEGRHNLLQMCACSSNSICSRYVSTTLQHFVADLTCSYLNVIFQPSIGMSKMQCNVRFLFSDIHKIHLSLQAFTHKYTTLKPPLQAKNPRNSS